MANSVPHSTAEPRSHPLRILMIDDNSEFAFPIAMSLQSVGHLVRLCSDGTSGLVALERFSPTVVLLDMELPDMHGLQLAATARNGGYRGVLIGLSARCDDALMRRVERSGLDHFVPKPCEMTELESTIVDLVGDEGAPPSR